MHGEQATPCQLVESSVPTCDFRTQSMRDKMTDTTIEEVIDKLKQFIQEQDPVFKKHFLSISQQPDAKIGLEDFRKVGTHALWGFLPNWIRVFHPLAILHCCCSFILQWGRVLVDSKRIYRKCHQKTSLFNIL